MTDQMPIVLKRTAPMLDKLAPPPAPLVMPKQVLAPRHGAIRRVLGVVLPSIALLKHSLRRVG
jgi:hypothetical protein